IVNAPGIAQSRRSAIIVYTTIALLGAAPTAASKEDAAEHSDPKSDRLRHVDGREVVEGDAVDEGRTRIVLKPEEHELREIERGRAVVVGRRCQGHVEDQFV